MSQPADKAVFERLHQQIREAKGSALDSAPLLSAAAGFLRTRSYDDALAAVRGALAIDPENPDGWALFGAALAGAGAIPDAIAAYEQALLLDDENLEASLELARLYADADRVDNALSLANWIILQGSCPDQTMAQAQALKDRLTANRPIQDQQP